MVMLADRCSNHDAAANTSESEALVQDPSAAGHASCIRHDEKVYDGIATSSESIIVNWTTMIQLDAMLKLRHEDDKMTCVRRFIEKEYGMEELRTEAVDYFM